MGEIHRFLSFYVKIFQNWQKFLGFVLKIFLRITHKNVKMLLKN